MKEPLKLPDYLPSRYNNWLEVYYDIESVFKEHQIEILEDTIVKLADFDFEVDAYQEFPITLIKSRAFDFMLDGMADYNKTLEFYYSYRQSNQLNPTTQEYDKIIQHWLKVSRK
ncbi:MAG: hypothetical protein NXI20_17925 [bacterium]|nr:hypothetical protein [bacterium]